jgi:CheY-like chemotaxis protein
MDPVLLEIMVSNVLLIVLEATRSGSVTPQLRYSDSHAIISITDTSIGARADADWFVRYQAMTESSVDGRTLEGISIGIALAKEIVRLHGGEIDLTSKPMADPNNSRSTFTARIPLKDALEREALTLPCGIYARQLVDNIIQWSDDNDSTDSASVPSDASASVEPFAEEDPLAKALMFEHSDRILLVDSNREIRESVRSVFKSFCTVTDVKTVPDALEQMSKVRPDIVVCSDGAENGNGLDLVAAIRSIPAYRAIPVVLLSSSLDAESLVAAFIAGVDDFLIKPFKTRELILRVHLHMQMGKKWIMLEKLYTAREQEIAVLSDYCPSGIMRTDANGSLTYANAAFQEPAGIQPGEDLDQWRTHADPKSLAMLEEKWQQIVTGNQTRPHVARASYARLGHSPMLDCRQG